MKMTERQLICAATSCSLRELMESAAALRDSASGDSITYSPKVFIPLTQLCRDVCHYCTFAKTPRQIQDPYLNPERVLEIARAGQRAGCREALFTLGDKPELRYKPARLALDKLGHATTLDYLAEIALLVLNETGLLPHINAGVIDESHYRRLRSVAPSMGLMLESISERLSQRGGPHYGSPDKEPSIRLESIRAAGRARVVFSTGILVGIGETREERLRSLVELRSVHEEFGHIQEIIIQNFVPKVNTKMADAPEPSVKELLWTVAIARHVFGSRMAIQAPPNLNSKHLRQLIRAGISDWGGISPITPDYVNPECPWPELRRLASVTAAENKVLVPRLTIYPPFVLSKTSWIDSGLVSKVLRHSDSDGYARDDGRVEEWAAGTSIEPMKPPPLITALGGSINNQMIARILSHAIDGRRLSEQKIEALFRARGAAVDLICRAADDLRRDVCGDRVSYVVNRNINYTNVCLYKCGFCAFSKGKTTDNLRGSPYIVDLAEIARRTREAWTRGATEVCLQGGIHPHFTGTTYLDICAAAKTAAPDIHIHAFSPLEVAHGAASLHVSIQTFLSMLKEAGLGSLPGTSAEILHDEVRREICPDKLGAQQWLDTLAAAHALGLRTTSTIMFGHTERISHWGHHLLALRDLQERTSGITEFVPLPYVHMESPMHRRGHSRPGPTYREVLLMHSVARLALHPLITNIQVSWVKLGRAGVVDCLNSGANDLGGTLMNESISRAAGSVHGQELSPESMSNLIKEIGRLPMQRDTLYRSASAERAAASMRAAPLEPMTNRSARDIAVAFHQ